MMTRNQYKQYVKELKKQYISPSKLYNYYGNDHISDYYKYRTNIKKETNLFQTFIFKQGNEFEKSVIEYIHTHIHKIRCISLVFTSTSIKHTKEMMQNGIPYIHSAPIFNENNKTYGIIDLLVRSDYINNLTDIPSLDNHYIPRRRNNQYYYIVIDIKYKALNFAADGIHLLNSKHKFHKAQCYIYTQAIGHLQGYTSRYAFILGKCSNYKDKNVPNCLYSLGKIDYEDYDKNCGAEVNNALDWLLKVRDIKEDIMVYPNMNVDSSSYNNVKRNYAIDNKEITLLWNVSTKHRDIAISKGIKSWNDSKLNSTILGYKSTNKKAKVIDMILDINNSPNGQLIKPTKITNNLYNWKEEFSENDIFLDFETLNNIFTSFENIPETKSHDIIFLIGVYHYDKKYDEWKYTHFLLDELTIEAECKMIQIFIDFLSSYNDPKIWYWSAEMSIFNRALRRHNITDIHYKWSDLMNIFISEPIVIHGCLNYKLKTVAKNMKIHNFITIDIESDCCNGLDCMVLAWDFYQNYNKSIMDDIILYNRFDCIVLYQILAYLRNNMK